MLELDKNHLEERLGQPVIIVKGPERAIGPGVIAYEHNTGKLSVYSEDGKTLKSFLKGDVIVQFADEKEYLVPQGLLKI